MYWCLKCEYRFVPSNNHVTFYSYTALVSLKKKARSSKIHRNSNTSAVEVYNKVDEERSTYPSKCLHTIIMTKQLKKNLNSISFLTTHTIIAIPNPSI